MKKVILIILSVLFCFGTYAQDTNKIDSKGRKQGLWRKYDEKTLLYEGSFVNDVPTGKFTYYHKNGKIKSICNFINGTTRVKTTLFHENGQKSGEGLFVDQIKDGVWHYYGTDGKLIKTEEYKNGEKEGDWKTYSAQTGILLEEATYSNGILNGTSKIYYINGDLQTEINYINGKRNGNFETYYSGKVLSSKGVYHNDLPIGTWTQYDGDGKLRKTLEYKDEKVASTYLHLYNGGAAQKVNIDLIAYIQKKDDSQCLVMMKNGNKYVCTEDFVYLKTLLDLDNFSPVTPNLVAANEAIKGYKPVDKNRILVHIEPALDQDVYSEGNEMHFVMMLFDTTPIKED
ncbi:MAG: toxin-antitoxin system YwqK family antitoxin [Bacteroidales bacterium]|nr:toxin-antitoxin system YwqK family antitoxin [Bacteroidales bacterium]